MAPREPAAPACAALFAYGSLQIPEIFEALTGSSCPSQPAQLPGFERRCVRNEVFPGIVAHASATTEGVLYSPIPNPAWVLLDAYEGELYERRLLQVLTSAGAEWAHTYVMRPDFTSQLASKPWNLQGFKMEHAAAYSAACRRLRQRLQRS